jgi:hypothetical protein
VPIVGSNNDDDDDDVDCGVADVRGLDVVGLGVVR